MDDKIKHQLKINKIREMKNPTILMNSDDFNAFKIELESTIQNFKVGENPTYAGIPIKSSEFIEKGNVAVYDDVSHYGVIGLTNKLNLKL